MNKQYLEVKPLLKKLAFAVCILGTMSSSAMAQSADERNTSSSAGLPSLSNSRAQVRQTPIVAAPPRAARATEKGPFETYVQSVTSADLRIFGKSLFADVPTTFAPFDGAQVNQDYLIGTGDELQVRGWGMVDIDVNATVDRSGSIYIPRVGSVKVSGVKYRDLQGYLKKAVGKFFNNFELTASISQTRAVQIYVVGQAVRPGTYTLSAMSTLLNALFTSGGPNASGTMRNIQLKRGGQTVTTFDLYDVLTKGDKSKDLSLEDGDVIYIPEVGPLVALTGNVKQSAIFELKGGQSNLAELIGWAGGVDSASEAKQIIVEKSIDNSYKSIIELTADSGTMNSRLAGIVVKPTDILRVFSPGAIPVEIRTPNEYVRVSGEIKQSGVFLLKKNETLRELIARLGGPTDKGYIFATQLNRDSVRRLQQDKLNEVADRFESELESGMAQRIAGSTDKDNIAVINQEVERQRRTAQRLRVVKAEGRIVLEMTGASDEVKNLPDLPLQDGDTILIPRRPATVDVLGSVFQQNAFIYRPKSTVNDYVSLAGGVTANADRSEMYVIRADGTARSGRNKSWISGGLGGEYLNPGDSVVVPEEIIRTSWMQNFKEWTTILYQFGLGAAGLKVLKD
jgi:polysaccharide export outer membrane protein